MVNVPLVDAWQWAEERMGVGVVMENNGPASGNWPEAFPVTGSVALPGESDGRAGVVAGSS
jgi:hypothetical protein